MCKKRGECIKEMRRSTFGRGRCVCSTAQLLGAVVDRIAGRATTVRAGSPGTSALWHMKMEEQLENNAGHILSSAWSSYRTVRSFNPEMMYLPCEKATKLP
jgi:hypothetical protein